MLHIPVPWSPQEQAGSLDGSGAKPLATLHLPLSGLSLQARVCEQHSCRAASHQACSASVPAVSLVIQEIASMNS